MDVIGALRALSKLPQDCVIIVLCTYGLHVFSSGGRMFALPGETLEQFVLYLKCFQTKAV